MAITELSSKLPALNNTLGDENMQKTSVNKPVVKLLKITAYDKDKLVIFSINPYFGNVSMRLLPEISVGRGYVTLQG